MIKKPKFVRQGGKNLKALGEKWRYPRGKQSKLRQHMKGKGILPGAGYGSPRKERGLHPSGLQEILVYNVDNLQTINPQKQAARIAATVGRKKRIQIMQKANEMKIKILNPLKMEER